MNREQFSQLVDDMECRESICTACCVLALLAFCFVSAVLGYKTGRKAGRIETYEHAVEQGFAERCTDGSFEWRKAGE